jgi:hypothetical protein
MRRVRPPSRRARISLTLGLSRIPLCGYGKEGGMTTHADHRYSATIHTDDLAVVNCLRALSNIASAPGTTISHGAGQKTETGSAKITY